MRREGQPDNIVSRNDQFRLSSGSETHDAPASGQAGRDVEVLSSVEGDALGASQTAVERRDLSGGRDAEDVIVTRGGGTGDVKVAFGSESQVVGGHAGLERGKNENLLIAIDLENRAAAVAHVEISFFVERDAGGNAHTLGVDGLLAVWRRAIDRSLVAAGNIQQAVPVEGEAGGVHEIL